MYYESRADSYFRRRYVRTVDMIYYAVRVWLAVSMSDLNHLTYQSVQASSPVVSEAVTGSEVTSPCIVIRLMVY